MLSNDILLRHLPFMATNLKVISFRQDNKYFRMNPLIYPLSIFIITVIPYSLLFSLITKSYISKVYFFISPLKYSMIASMVYTVFYELTILCSILDI